MYKVYVDLQEGISMTTSRILTAVPYDEIPSKAGQAQIELGSTELTDQWRPVRVDDIIVLPLPLRPFGDTSEEYGYEFYSLLDGEQFLVYIYRTLYDGPRLFLGGTDETPFLVELESKRPRVDFSSEVDFYAWLEPQEIKTCKEQVESIQAGRQGDIWFCSLDRNWEEIETMHRRLRPRMPFLPTREPSSLFGTRHVVTGKIVVNRVTLDFVGESRVYEGYTIGSGILTAPDHADITLDGPHLLARTHCIIDPRTTAELRSSD